MRVKLVIFIVVLLTGFVCPMVNTTVRNYSYYPTDSRQMIWIVMKRISGFTFLAAVISPSISYVEFLAIRTGTLTGSIKFGDLGWASAAVVIAGLFCLLICASLHVHVNEK
ncbi:hypothetical protein HYR99_38200 [Candidatus Poribacteria bacterium]|nr:hypothetical protein [Candidatus Poribacteria bacterium]